MTATSSPRRKFRDDRFLQVIAAVFVVAWIILAIKPVDRKDWFLENLLVFVAVPILVFTYRRFQFSRTSYFLIAAFMILHEVGAHYTYAKVPLGYWLKEVFNLERNHYDRLIHCGFGLLLTYSFFEILRRVANIRGAWTYLLALAVIISASNLFEIIEAIIAIIVSPELGTEYLGTQGDIWDAQKDMAAASVGAVCAALLTAFARRSPGTIAS
jgi:putative membrane protein